VLREYPESKKILEGLKEESLYSAHLCREVCAIEEALSLFTEPERAVIRERFWSYPDKNKSYEQMWELGYSSRQMRRIAYKMIYQTGKRLGEIE
jgi:hypothetical protein